MSEKLLDELPEAVPLHRVSASWRTIAIVTMLGGVALLVLVFFLAMLVVRLQAQAGSGSTTVVAPGPVGWAATGPVTVAESPSEVDDPANAVNLPYPVVEDLRPTDGLARPDAQAPGRERFLTLGEEVWKLPRDAGSAQPVISPDGTQVAYFKGANLVIGPFTNLQTIDVEQSLTNGGGVPRVNVTNVQGSPTRVRREQHLVGSPAWSADGSSLYFANAAGRMYRFDLQNQTIERLPFIGQSPTPIPGNANKIVFLRSLPLPKMDAPGTPPSPDPMQIVVGDLQAQQVRVVVPSESARWKDLAVSPDGRLLAAASDRERNPQDHRAWRLYKVELASGKVEALGPPAQTLGPVCWTPDNRALVYVHSQEPLPPDCRVDAPAAIRASDLFERSIDKGPEIRLSRGGGFACPGMAKDGSLFYLYWKADAQRLGRQYLQKASLSAVQKFAAAEAELPPRTAAVWAEFFEKVCKAAEVPVDADGSKLTEAMLTRLADGFARDYKERFGEEAPADPVSLDVLVRQELAPLSFSRENRACMIRVLGAVQGEYLRRQHGAHWHLADGSLTRPVDPLPAEGGTALEVLYNPFAILAANAADSEERPAARPGLGRLLNLAEGRPILLTNDAATGRALLAKSVDADLARGRELLDQGKSEEGERVLLDMLGREEHQRNRYLALLVGKMLDGKGRNKAVRKLMEKQIARYRGDARLHNLLGLALAADNDPGQAVSAYKSALRCDLHYGPAYLNLAQAYELTGDTRAARACLRRYLDLMPHGPFADDAARRLAALEGP